MADEYSPIEVKCGHCDNFAFQRVVARYVDTVGQWYDEETETVEGGDEWTLLLSFCATCKRVNYSVADDGWNISVIFPESKFSDATILPTSVAKAYKAARAVRFIDTNAFAVLLGRVLETLCIDRKAEGDTLYLQLKYLSEKGELPGALANIVLNDEYDTLCVWARAIAQICVSVCCAPSKKA